MARKAPHPGVRHRADARRDDAAAANVATACGGGPAWPLPAQPPLRPSVTSRVASATAAGALPLPLAEQAPMPLTLHFVAGGGRDGHRQEGRARNAMQAAHAARPIRRLADELGKLLVLIATGDQ